MTRDKDRRPPSERSARAERDAEATTGARPPSPPPAAATPIRQRIAKVIARAGLCSRRDAEAWIVQGRVAVNGTVLTSPATDVGPDDAIVVDDAPLPAAEKTRLFLFHKPRGLVVSDHDPEGRVTVTDFLRESWPEGPRVVTIGRLDINTEGLLLLTNDGGLARVLELPKTGWVRRYRVRAKGETDQGALDALREGLTIDGIDYAGIEATLDRTQGSNCWLTMGLREGKNREIKRVLEHLGLEVNRLIRLSFGPFQLLDLAEGAVEEVKTRILRDQLGERIAAEAGVSFDIVTRVAEGRGPQTRAISRPEPSRRDAPPPRPGGDARRPVERDRREPAPRNAWSDRPASRDGFERHGRGASAEPDQKRRERPVGGTRKHVSTLRAERTEAPVSGRQRIERSDVKDRRDRTVTVERVVSTRVEAPSRSSRRPSGRSMSGGADHASPSALAKRQRVAKSAGLKSAGLRVDRTGEMPARERPDEGRGEGRPVHRGKPRADGAAWTGRRAEAAPHQERERNAHRPNERGERTRTDGKPTRGGEPGHRGRSDAAIRHSRPPGKTRSAAAGREGSDERHFSRHSGKPWTDSGKPRAASGGGRERAGKGAGRATPAAGRNNRGDRTKAAPSRSGTRPRTPPKGSGSPRRT